VEESLLKKIDGKVFDLGELYVVPWKIDAWDTRNGISLKDGSLVVLLDVDMEKYDVSKRPYCLHLLTLNGERTCIWLTHAALDYWKTLEQTKKRKK
jgi:hypothetical protein